MERKEFIGHCKAYALAKAKGDRRGLENAKVLWHDHEYVPEAYKLSFCPDGEPRHTAVLIDDRSNATHNVRLSEVEAWQTPCC